ncbi:MAG: rod shape-determining protein [Acidobacteria bacterium]|nr:rod shape-determining protein [Acidobacteriota bacterium]
MTWSRIKQFFGRGLGIDLGTVNTLIYSQGRGIVLNEPSAIAVNRFNGRIIAVGREAMNLIGREPRDVVVHRPIENGVVADYELVQQMLRAFLRRIVESRVELWRFHHAVVGTSNSATDVERQGVRDAVLHAGASHVWLVGEGVAAALGAGVLFDNPGAHLVVDIGGGTTNISLVCSAGAIISRSVSVAGLAIDRAIREYIRHEYKVLIGERVAEAIKIKMASALPYSEDHCIQVIGRSLNDKAPCELEIYSDELFFVLNQPLQTIIESIKLALSEVPPDTLADMHETGILLVGGGSLLRNLDVRLSHEINLLVMRAERPLEAVALGVGYLLDHPSWLDRLQVSNNVPSWEFETEVDHAARASSAFGLQ